MGLSPLIKDDIDALAIRHHDDSNDTGITRSMREYEGTRKVFRAIQMRRCRDI